MIASGDLRRLRTTFFSVRQAAIGGEKIRVVGRDDRPPAACFRGCGLSPMQVSADNARWSHDISTSSFAETTIASALKE